MAQVQDLLLAPVAATADHVHGYPPLLERALEQTHRRGGAEQHHDVAVRPGPLPRELVHALREQPRLGRSPGGRAVHRLPECIGLALQELLPAFTAPVDHQQVHARGRARLGLAGPRRLAQRLEALAPDALERQVDRVEHLPARAEVDRDALGPPLGVGALPVPAKHAHVRVPEAVDGLVLVADPEEVVAGQQLEQLVLELVGVLELVHEHVLEARGVGLSKSLVCREQVARDQLQVLEVECRALALEPLVAVPVQLEQRAQHRVITVLALGHLEGPVRLERLPVLLARVSGEHPCVAALEGCASLDAVDRLGHRGGGGRQGELGQSRPGRILEPLVLTRRARRERLVETRVALPSAAQMGVGGPHHVAQRIRAVGGHHLDAVGLGAVAHELLERAVERVGGEPLRLELVEYAEVGIDAGAERVSAQHARAEAVDGRDPRALGRARLLATSQVEEAAPYARPHLGGGLLGEGDREDRLDADLVLRHGQHEALHQHGCLAGARARPYEQGAVPALDRAALLRGQLPHRSLLQIDGYLQPPFQSQLSGWEQISPLRMRASVARIRSSAQSSFARNSSASSRSLA